MADAKGSAGAATALANVINADFLVVRGGANERVPAQTLLDFIGDTLSNQSVADQAVAAATLTYLTGSMLTVPAAKIRNGTVFKWILTASKTAAGVAARTFHVRIGVNGTTADTAVLSFLSTSAPTAAVDEGVFEIVCTVRGANLAAATIQGVCELRHNGNTVGFAVIPVHIIRALSAAVDLTVANLKVGLSLTTGAAEVITFQQVIAEAKNL